MSHDQLNYEQRIHEKGGRLTPQRQIILDTLCGMGGHATASDIYDQVHQQMPAINRATVYRTLAFFCELDVLVSGEIESQTVYEIATPTPHHHLICRACGYTETLSDGHFDQLIQHLVKVYQFQAEISHLTISGLCAHCQQNDDE